MFTVYCIHCPTAHVESYDNKKNNSNVLWFIKYKYIVLVRVFNVLRLAEWIGHETEFAHHWQRPCAARCIRQVGAGYCVRAYIIRIVRIKYLSKSAIRSAASIAIYKLWKVALINSGTFMWPICCCLNNLFNHIYFMFYLT